MGNLKKNTLAPINYVPKKFSDTRCLVRADSVKAVDSGYANFKDALNKICEDITQKPGTKVEAQGLLNELNSLETAFMVKFWSEILEIMDKLIYHFKKLILPLKTLLDYMHL